MPPRSKAMSRGKSLPPSKVIKAVVKAAVRKAVAKRVTPDERPKGMKSKERAVTEVERRYWDRLAGEIGCIACRVSGHETGDWVSIHHINGRTVPGCHSQVLPLCAGHHQQGTGNDKTLVAVHPYKARFEKLYGTQVELKALCDRTLGGASNA